MKKDDNTTNYSARLVCEKCGYVFGLKEVAYEEIRNGIEKLKEINKLKNYELTSPKNITKILSYCNADIAFTECCEDAPLCWDCEVVKQYCSIGDCPEKNAVSPKYFEKNGFYICAVFYTLSNANEFAKYLFHRTNNGRSDNISLLTISSAISRNNGYARMHKAGSFESIGAIPQTNEGRCGWSRKELKEYGIAIDFEKHPNTNEDIFCVYLPVPKYFGDKKEASK